VDVVAQLDKLEAALASIEERHEQLGVELVTKREILDGPMYERSIPGAIGKLQELRRRDPEQFKPSGEAIGPDARKLQTEIDEVGDLGPLTAEIEHTGLLADKARRDRDAFVGGHADELLEAKRGEAEAKPLAVAAAVERLRNALSDYIAFAQVASGLLRAAGRDDRLPGEDRAAAFRHALDADGWGNPLPSPIEAEPNSELHIQFEGE
jgi:hypothetical protein